MGERRCWHSFIWAPQRPPSFGLGSRLPQLEQSPLRGSGFSWHGCHILRPGLWRKWYQPAFSGMGNRFSNSMWREVPAQLRPSPDLAWCPNPLGW